VERIHSKKHTPNLPTHPPLPAKSTKSLICKRLLTIRRGSTTHFRLAHVNKGLFEGQPFPCPECIRQGKGKEEVERINGREAWDDHIERVHRGIQTLAGEVLQNTRPGRRRRKRRSGVQKAQASIEIETDSDVVDDDGHGSSCRKRRRISEGGSRDISEAPTLVEDVSTIASSPQRNADDDEELEITSRIDPRLLENGLTSRNVEG
jgi:hypothetical protein